MDNFNLVNTLMKKTLTYDYWSEKTLNMNHLHYNYHNAYDKSSRRINNIINQINSKKMVS